MRGGVGDGRMVDGGAIFGIVIYDMVTFGIHEIGDSRMTYGVMVSSAITSYMVASRKRDIGHDGEVHYRRKVGGDGRLVDGGVISSVVTSNIVASMRGNKGDIKVVNGDVVSDMTCSRREGLGGGDAKGEGESVEA